MSITVALDITAQAKPPRAVFVPFMMGHHFGVPFHRELQRQIICAALEHLVNARQSGEVLSLPLKWAQARREGLALEQAGALVS